MLKQIGEPSSLLRAKLQQGLDLTVKDVKTILASLGVHLKGAPSKATCYEALIKCVAENDEEAKTFAQKSALNDNPDEKEAEDDEFNELLELLEEDTENRDDPDIKQEKKKRKKLANTKSVNPTWKQACSTKEKRQGKG